MGKYWVNWILLLFMGCYFSHGQAVLSANQPGVDYPNLPEERIFVHYNTTLLLAGEYLYYKVYNLNAKTKGLSALSKIAYVELLGENQQQIFKHKVLLENSTGQGDFFLPTTVPSGNYKLVAYTQWMKNGSKSHFFQGDIAIINPYQSDQEHILAQADSLGYEQAKQRQTVAIQKLRQETSNLQLNLAKQQNNYQKRTEVSLDIQPLVAGATSGSYSLSIRKVDTVAQPDRPTSQSFYLDSEQWTTRTTSQDSDFHPPELRGELLYGKVVPLDSTSRVEEVPVMISIPGGTGYELKLVSTNAQGLFFVSLEKEYSGDQATMQVLGPNRRNYKIELPEKAITENWDLTFSDFELIPEMREMIVEKSVHNQIENGYFSVKPDSLQPVRKFIPLDTGRMVGYNLDDYTRFPTVRETVVEVIDQVWSKRIARGEFVFQVLPYRDDFYVESDMLPLVLVDGVPTQNHTHLLAYNARNVRRIEFIRDKYVVGPKVFQGVLSFETFKKDYAVPFEGDHHVTADLFKPEPHKRYFRQQYGAGGSPDAERLLDFRYQLLWEPNFALEPDGTSVTFYTSDVSGLFEACLEGFTDQGQAVTLRQLFEVAP